jgi:hypothetical protein
MTSVRRPLFCWDRFAEQLHRRKPSRSDEVQVEGWLTMSELVGTSLTVSSQPVRHRPARLAPMPPLTEPLEVVDL